MPGPEVDRQQNARTLQYTGGRAPRAAAGVTSGRDTAETQAGQAAVLSAVNMLARVHPTLAISVPDVPLVVSSPLGGATLADACAELAAAANPAISVARVDALPPDVLSVGIGASSPAATVYAGARRWTALTGQLPQPCTPDPSSLVGLAMGTSLACSAIFRAAIGLPFVRERAASLWTLSATAKATGPSDCAPIDVGSVWMVGAGAVASALVWWLQFIGVAGPWTVLDKDLADVTNLNRSLALFARDTNLFGGPVVNKATAAARLLAGATPVPAWWHEFVESDPPAPDVVLSLANEHGVRAAVAAYGHPAVVHASTSPNWSAELHRHLLEQDDCISCRLPEAAPRFKCATAPAAAPARSENPGNDAALPFLSGAAGLLLLAGIAQLQEGVWATHRANHWRWWFDDSARVASAHRWQCAATCASTPAQSVRRVVHAATRWHELDPGQRTG